MRLRRIRIRNFRSIYDDGDDAHVTLNLSPKGNYIAGPNNVGKSNIIRALQLALRPAGRREYDPAIDIPKQKAWAWPTITLDFHMERRRGPYKTLLRYVDEYERSVPGADSDTFADQEMVRFHVQHTTEPNSRQELFLANGAGSVKGDDELLDRALEQFHDVIRLVDIQSGEDIDGLLQRGFDELFAKILSEGLSDEIESAGEYRESYQEHIQEQVLGPIAEYIGDQLPGHVPEVENVLLSPTLDTVDEVLSEVNIQMDDTVETPLEFKGTGVRSAVLLMMMAFIADASRRAIVFAIEEPEAFIHPEQHAALGRRIESFTNQSDISLITTTHSPFILTNDSEAGVFTVSKNAEGRTLVDSDSSKEQAIREAHRLLTGTESIPTALDIIDRVPDDAEGIVVVEGLTDATYLRVASDQCREGDLLDGIHIVDSEGAKEAVKDALVLKTIFEDEKPIHVLLDDDVHGENAKSALVSRLDFHGRDEVSQYSRWRPKRGRDVEAEDLFPDDWLESFQDEYGADAFDAIATRDDGALHIEISSSAKGNFAQWVEDNATGGVCETWIQLLYDIREIFNLPDIEE